MEEGGPLAPQTMYAGTQEGDTREHPWGLQSETDTGPTPSACIGHHSSTAEPDISFTPAEHPAASAGISKGSETRTGHLIPLGPLEKSPDKLLYSGTPLEWVGDISGLHCMERWECHRVLSMEQCCGSCGNSYLSFMAKYREVRGQSLSWCKFRPAWKLLYCKEPDKETAEP